VLRVEAHRGVKADLRLNDRIEVVRELDDEVVIEGYFE